MSHPIPDVTLMDGFHEDVKRLIEKVVALLKEGQSFSYSHFAKVWTDMNFSLIFTGRSTYRELYEFAEEGLKIVKDQFVKTNDEFQKAACLFMLYGLYFKQPLRPRAKINVLCSDFKNFLAFSKRCREIQQWEMACVWAKLWCEFAFNFVVYDDPVGIERVGNRHSSLEQFMDPEDIYKLNLVSFNEHMKGLALAHSEYMAMKSALIEHGVRDPGLKLISDKFPDKLNNSISIMRGLQKETTVEQPPTQNEDSIGDRRKKLIEKSFGNRARVPGIKGVALFNEIDFEGKEVEEEEKSPKKRSRRGKIGQKKPPQSPRKGNQMSPNKKKSPGRPSLKEKVPRQCDQEFVLLAQSLEAVKQDPYILQTLSAPSTSGAKSKPSKKIDGIEKLDPEIAALDPNDPLRIIMEYRVEEN